MNLSFPVYQHAHPFAHVIPPQHYRAGRIRGLPGRGKYADHRHERRLRPHHRVFDDRSYSSPHLFKPRRPETHPIAEQANHKHSNRKDSYVGCIANPFRIYTDSFHLSSPSGCDGNAHETVDLDIPPDAAMHAQRFPNCISRAHERHLDFFLAQKLAYRPCFPSSSWISTVSKPSFKSRYSASAIGTRR